jgi:hypothetical protein
MAVPEFTSQESKEALRLIALLNGSLQFIAARLEELSKSKILSPIGKKPRNAANSRGIREQFSGLQTVWRWMQSIANPSLVGIPFNREKYREFWPAEGV